MIFARKISMLAMTLLLFQCKGVLSKEKQKGGGGSAEDSMDSVDETLASVRKKLCPTGTFEFIGPNYKIVEPCAKGSYYSPASGSMEMRSVDFTITGSTFKESGNGLLLKEFAFHPALPKAQKSFPQGSPIAIKWQLNDLTTLRAINGSDQQSLECQNRQMRTEAPPGCSLEGNAVVSNCRRGEGESEGTAGKGGVVTYETMLCDLSVSVTPKNSKLLPFEVKAKDITFVSNQYTKSN